MGRPRAPRGGSSGGRNPARPLFWASLILPLLVVSQIPAFSSEAKPEGPAAPHHGDACVVSPGEIQEAIRSGALGSPEKFGDIGVGSWQGDIYLLSWPFGEGAYDRDVNGMGNIQPRQWVTRSFLGNNLDRYDFLLVFTNFPWESGPAAGIYWGVKNDTTGIGWPLFDNSVSFGTEHVQGYIDAKQISDYRLADGSLDERQVTAVLDHEFGHRWLSKAKIDQGLGPVEDLLGADGAHWSYLLDSEASFMYGARWTDNGDGTFTSTEQRRRFSDLDLYLMGMIPPEQVDSFTLLVNPEIDPTQIDSLGDTIEATPLEVFVEDVIAAEGPRQPTWAESQKEFRVGVVYLVAPEIGYTEDDLRFLGEIKSFWRESLFRETRGRAVVDPTFQGDPPPGNLQVDLGLAVDWLSGDGHLGLWRDSDLTVARDTAEAVEALGRAGGFANRIEEALEHLPSASAESAELRYRRLEAQARWGREIGGDFDDVGPALEAALAERLDDGGWASLPRYRADAVTTARASRALRAAGRPAEAAGGWAWLVARQNSDGGWGWQVGSPSSVVATLETLLVARHLDLDGFWALPAVQRGVDWVLGKEQAGGYGDEFPRIEATALFLELIEDQDVDQNLIRGATSFLAGQQLADGSWQRSAYKTGLVIKALAPYLLPDPYVDSAEVMVNPATPYDDQEIEWVAAVRNSGIPLVEPIDYVWELIPDGGSEAIEAVYGTIPPLADFAFHTVTDILRAQFAGRYTVRFTLDPSAVVGDRSRENNSVELPLTIRSHPEGIDLALSAYEIAAVPAEIIESPQDLRISGILRNEGLTDGDGVLVALFESDGLGQPVGTPLATRTLDAPSLDFAAFSLEATLPEARTYDLVVVADPERDLEDVDRFNNRAPIRVRLRLRPNLEIRQLIADPTSAVLGEPVGLEALVRNSGTRSLGDFEVLFEGLADGAGAAQLIQRVPVVGPLEPGAEITVSATWLPNLAGAVTLGVEVDPQGLTGDEDPGDDRLEIPYLVGGSALTNLRALAQNLSLDPSPPRQGEMVTARAIFENPSAIDAPAFRAELWLDAPDALSGSLLNEMDFGGLLAGGTVELEGSWQVEEIGARTVFAVVDPADAVVEFSEDDNQAFIVAEVRSLPDLQLSAGGISRIPDFPRVGESIHFDVQILNGGDQASPISSLELVDAEGRVLASAEIPSLGAEAQTSVGLDWDPTSQEPGGLSGELNLQVRANPSASFAELDRSNNSVSISLAIQDGDLSLANRIFSPNGDGVRDTVTAFFRVPGTVLEIVDEQGRLLRTLAIPGAAESVIWDGRDEEGDVVADGVYLLRLAVAGGARVETWAAVDNNLSSVISELEQKLVVGFLEPELPGEGPDSSRFVSLIANPLTDEAYVVERSPDPGGGGENHSLKRFAGGDLIEIGPYPADSPRLLSANAGGDIFSAGEFGSYRLLRYPGPVEQPLTSPGGGASPWLSPDGRWLLWASAYQEEVVLEALDGSGAMHTVDAGPVSGYFPCGFSLTWVGTKRAVISRPTESSRIYFLDIDLSVDPPRTAVVQADGTLEACGGGLGLDGGGAPKAGGGSGGVDLDGSVGPELESITWILGPMEELSLTSGDGDGGAKMAGAGPEVRRHDLVDGSSISSRILDVGGDPFSTTTPLTSLSTDGEVVALLANPDRFPLSSPPPKSEDLEDTENAVSGISGDSSGDPENLVPSFSPELLTRLRDAGKWGASGHDGRTPDKAEVLADGQHLVEWVSGESRELPLTLGQALWTAADKYVIGDLEAGEEFEGRVPYYTSAANLTALIRPRVLFGNGGIDLFLIATDRYLDNYFLEYADLDELAPDGQSLVYQPIGLPSSEPLFGERWGTWLPPGNGRYRLRLTVRDLAGNQRRATKRVVWNGDSDIANLSLEQRYLSPRSSPGTKDVLTFHYTVLRPANLNFVIQNEDGEPVVELAVAAPVTGPMTSQFGGDDGAGNPLPDGNYLLTLGEASWPFVIDNTSPELSLRISDGFMVLVPSPPLPARRDLLVHELFAGARDENLLRWTYERRSDGGEWVEVTTSDRPLERDGDVAWRALGAHDLVLEELRLVARDLAGNRAAISRSHRDELILFTESEPVCRGLSVPCTYPDRPALETFGDGAGLFGSEARILDDDYESLLVQSTVWTADLDLSLEYRLLGPGDVPGPWTPGDIEVAPTHQRRRLCSKDLSPSDLTGSCTPVEDGVRRLYWNHLDLQPARYQVRLKARNQDGDEISSAIQLFEPPQPLRIEHVGVSHEGDLLRITNTGQTVVSQIEISRKILDGAGDSWISMFLVQGALEPGQFIDTATDCRLVDRGGALLRAEGITSHGEAAISFPTRVPDRDGFPELRSTFFSAGCGEGPGGPGLGFLGEESKKPCEVGPLDWPKFWIGRGDGPMPVSGFIPRDPTGAVISTYRLDINGAPFLTLNGPFPDGLAYEAMVDFSDRGEGTYQISENIGYVGGEQGLLATCQGVFPLTIDRTPPEVTIIEPRDGDFVCPDDSILDVVVQVVDEGETSESILVDGVHLAGRPECTPYGAPGGTYEVVTDDIEPGLRLVQARITDDAGNTTCTVVEVQVPDLPAVDLQSTPSPFSPTNDAGRPTELDSRFSIGSPGTYRFSVEAADGTLIQTLPETQTSGEEVSVAWDGRDLSGALMPDGVYTVIVVGVSPCGATDSATRTAALDTTPPEVLIGAPQAGAEIGAVVEVQGLVNDRHFDSYEIEVRTIAGEWQSVASSTRQTEDLSSPLGTWQTDGFAPGSYLVRIYAKDLPGNEAWSAEIPVTLRERRLVQSFTRSPAIFSPNGDGFLDFLELEVSLLEDALISLHVEERDGTRVATLLDREPMAVDEVRDPSIWDGVGEAAGPFPDQVAADGAYRLVLVAEDPSTPPTLNPEREELSVIIDTVPPALDLTNPVEDALTGLPVAIVGALEELHPDRFTLRLGDVAGDFEDLLEGTGTFPSRELTVLRDREDGPRRLIFEAVDLAGNRSSLERPFLIDDTAPAVSWTYPVAGSVLNTALEPLGLRGLIEETHLEAWSFSYAPGSSPATMDFVHIHGEEGFVGLGIGDGPVDWDWDASGLVDGPYSLRLEARDELGRRVEARIGIIVDNTPPTLTIDNPADGATLSSGLDILGSVVDANPKAWRLDLVSADGGQDERLSSGIEDGDGTLAPWPVLPVDGAYSLHLSAEDLAGNGAELEVGVIVATTPMSPPILLTATVNGRDVTLTWEPGPGPLPVGYAVYRDGVLVSPGQLDPAAGLEWTESGLADGTYLYQVTAFDVGGLETAPSNTLDAQVDSASPIAQISVPSDGDRISDQVQIIGTAFRESDLEGWTLSVRGVAGEWQVLGTGTAPVLSDLLAAWDTVLFANGPYELRLEVRDRLGQVASDQISVEVDNAEPAAPVLTVASASAQGADGEVDDIHVEWILDPSAPDLAGFYLYRNGQLANAPGPVVGSTEPFLIDANAYDDQDLADGTYTYFVTAADLAGNESAASNLSDPITIDTRRPHARIVDPADGSAFETSVVLVAEVPDLDVVSMVFEARPESGGAWTTIGAPLAEEPWRVLFEPAALGLDIPGVFEVQVIASDAVGPDPAPESILIEERDLPPTGAPELSSRVDGGEVHLSWIPAIDPNSGDPDDGVVGYNLYRDGDLITATPLAAVDRSYIDRGELGIGLEDQDYSYRIAAVDGAGLEGPHSAPTFAIVTTAELEHIKPITPSAAISLAARVFEHEDFIEIEKLDDSGVYQTIATVPGTEDASGSTVQLPALELEEGWNTFRVRGISLEGDRTKATPGLVILRHQPPAKPENLSAAVSLSGAGTGDVTLEWQSTADPDLHGFHIERGNVPVGFTDEAWTYDVSHALGASTGDPADWLLVVDGSHGTAWEPGTSQATYFEWTWTGEPAGSVLLEDLTLRFAHSVFSFSIDVLVDGHWLWWHHQRSNFTTFHTIELGLAVQGVRLRFAENSCFGCRVFEIGARRGLRPQAPPILDAGRPVGAEIYGVVALNRFGQLSERADTQALIGVEAPMPPEDLEVVVDGCAELRVSWRAPSTLPANLIGYRLERSVDGGEFRPWLDVAEDILEAVDRGLAESSTYAYRARTLAEIDGVTVVSDPSNEDEAMAICSAIGPPELIQPTTPGLPILWPSTRADIGGRGHPGSLVKLVHDDQEIRALRLPAGSPDRLYDVPGFLQESDDPWALVESVDADGSPAALYVAYLDSIDGAAFVRVERIAADGAGIPEFVAVVAVDEPRQMALSPDGSTLAFVDRRNFSLQLISVDLTTGEQRILSSADSEPSSPRFSANGRALLFLEYDFFSGDGVLRRVDLSTGGLEEIWRLPFTELRGLGLSADGALAAVGTWEGPKIVEVATGLLVQEFLTYESPAFSPSPFSPDHRHLVFVAPTWNAENAWAHIGDVASGASEAIGPSAGDFAVSFTDSQTLTLLRAGADGRAALVSSSRFDGAESVWREGIDLDQLPALRAGGGLVRGPGGGLWLVSRGRLVRFDRPSGGFVFPDVSLEAGSNIFSARQEIETDGGLDEQQSLPIEVIVDAMTFGNLQARSLLGAPSFPILGQTVALEGVVLNDGAADLDGVQAHLIHVAPGGEVEVAESWTFDLDAGAEYRPRFIWRDATIEGTHRFRLVVDPENRIVELDEADNTVSLEIPLRGDFGLQASLRGSRNKILTGESLALLGDLASNAPPADTEVELVIESTAGSRVEVVATWSLSDFGYGSRDFASVWSSGEVYPAPYRARLLASQGGELEAEASFAFEVLAREDASVLASADRPSYIRGEVANLLARVRNAGDATLRDARVRLVVEPALAGPAVATVDRDLLPLPVDGLRNVNWAFDTDLTPGAYSFRAVVFTVEGQELAASEPYPFMVTPLGAALTGTLVATPPVLEPGNSLEFRASLANLGDLAVVDSDLRVEVIDPSSGVVVHQINDIADLDVGGLSIERQWPYAPTMTALGPYMAVLSATDGAAGQRHALATASFLLADLSPPIVEVLDPEPLCSLDWSTRARVSDRFSSIREVTYGIDDGPLALPMIAETLEGDIWTTRVRIDPDRTTPYHFEIVAEDAAGQISTPVEVDLLPEVDLEAPILTVNAPDEGTCVASPAVASFTADDANLATLQGWLNGEPYSPGTPIGDGLYELRVRALDLCGHVAEQARSFAVDAGAPVLSVEAPPAGACVEGPVSVSFEASDGNLESVEAWLNGVAYLAGTPIFDGSYELRVVATDSCGNMSEDIRSFTVDSAPPMLEVSGVPVADLCVAGPVAASFEATDANLQSVLAWLDGIPYLAGTPIEDGDHDLRVLAADSCGHTSEEFRAFTVDSSAPSIEITGLPDDGACVVGPVTPTIEVTDANLQSVLTWLDGEPYLAGDPIADGEHELRVVATDSCGQTTEETRLFTVDSAPPLLDVTGVPDGGACVVGPVAASFEASDANLLSVQAWLNDEAYLSGTSIGDGEYQLRVEATDLCEQVTAVDRDFIVDSLAPLIEVIGVEDNEIYDGSVIFEWQVSDLNTVDSTATLNGVEIFAPHEVFVPGTYILAIEAVDCAGNTSRVELVFVLQQGVNPIEIPTLHPWALAFLALLLSCAGLAFLRRRQLGFDPQSPASRRRFDEENSTMHDLRRAFARWFSGLGFLFLFALLGFIASPVEAEQADIPGVAPAWAPSEPARCFGQFPELKRFSSQQGEEAPAQKNDTKRVDAWLGEIRVEEALWADELERRRTELSEAETSGRLRETKGLGSVRDRLSRLDQDLREQLNALAGAVEKGDFQATKDLSRLSACFGRSSGNLPGELADDPPRSWQPISSQLAPRALELEPRRPQRSEALPEGYVEGPDEAFRQRVRKEAARLQEMQESVGGSANKVASGRVDPVLAKVAELGNDPVAIYRFVLEKIRPGHYFGAIRGAEATLLAGEGNDADQAMLLATLLRVAGVPARVAWGTQEVDTDALKNHFGLRPEVSVSELEKTLTMAGIPWEPVLIGGQPRAYLLERAWAEAYIPYANYRGVVLDQGGTTWLALDPQMASLELSDTAPALDLLGIEGRAFVDSYLGGTTCTAPSVGAGACQSPSTWLAARVDELGAETWSERTAAAAALAAQDAVLPAGMVGLVRSIAGFGFEFPAEWNHRVRLRARAGVKTLMDEIVPASLLSGREAVIWYRPATPEDEAVVAAYRDLWLTPPYLVEVKPELWVDGESVAVGRGAVGMGEAFELEITLLLPSGDQLTFRNQHSSGAPVGLGLAPGKHGYKPPEDGPANTPEVLATLVGAYLDSTADFASRLARLESLVEVHPYPSFASVGSVVEGEGLFGLVEELKWLGIFVDADLFGPRVVGSPAAARRWLEIVQLESSVQERALFENYGIASASADRLLIFAQEEGIDLVSIDGTNLTTVLPGLPFPPAVIREIDGWVRAGGEALVPEAALDFVDFAGVGYVLRDPLTGEARYQLAGDISPADSASPAGLLSGGMTAAPVFEIAPELANPLRNPQQDPVIRDPDAAISLEIYRGNFQVDEVGSRLAPILLLVRDDRGRLVSGADVTFEVIAGGGTLRGSSSVVVRTIGGFATTELVLGTETLENPYYLLFPEQEWVQRTDLTIVTATVNGYSMLEPIYGVAFPGEVVQLDTPQGTILGNLVPHASGPRSLSVVPSDRFGNPVANEEVTFALNTPSPGPGLGPELVSDSSRLECGSPAIIVAGECTASQQVVDTGSFAGVRAYLVPGNAGTYHVRTTGGSAPAVTFAGQVGLDLNPTLIYSRRPAPFNAAGQPIEAYAPGDRSLPVEMSLVVVQPDEQPGTDWDRRSYQIRRLATGGGLPDCTDPDAAEEMLTETAVIAVESPDSAPFIFDFAIREGVFQQTVELPQTPGQYEVKFTLQSAMAAEMTSSPCGDGYHLALTDDWDIGPDDAVEYTLWSAQGTITEAPLLALGHGKRMLRDTEVVYELEPADYPAGRSAMYFYEDDAVVASAVTESAGDGSVLIPRGTVFQRPEGRHEAVVLINPGIVWNPTGSTESQTRGILIESDPESIQALMFDADLDSNNDNGFDPPDDSLVEENIQGEGLGKFVFVNQDDSDRDGKPDYASFRTDGETSMVPLTLEIRPEQGNYSAVDVIFHYLGPSAEEMEDFIFPIAPMSELNGYLYYDYREKAKGQFRVWNIESQDSAHSAFDYLVPGQRYSAEELGFGPGEEKKTFWVEGVQGGDIGDALSASQLFMVAEYEGESFNEDLKLTMVKANLGLNNSNDTSRLRPGIPDSRFRIDGADELVEDQGLGYIFWRGLPDSDDDLTSAPAEDLMPFIIDIPEELLEDWEVRFEFSGGATEEGVLATGAAREDHSRLMYLNSEGDYDRFFAALEEEGRHYPFGGSHEAPILEFDQPRNGLLLAFQEWEEETEEEFPLQTHHLHLQMRRKETDGAWISVDSARLTLASPNWLYEMWSVRDRHDRNFDFPLECHPQSACDEGIAAPKQRVVMYGPARRVDGPGERDGEKEQHLIFVHGYNVDQEDVKESSGIVAKRIFWKGYRGNLIVFNWEGDETIGFSPNVKNAFQSAPALHEFLRERVISSQNGGWGIDPQNINVFAHSLGNQVVMGALRLDRIANPSSGRLFNHFLSFEPAVWSETLWPQEEKTFQIDISGYIPLSDITYSVDDLRTNSWAFWYTNEEHPAMDKVESWTHSWASEDYALHLMRLDDYFIRNPYQHGLHRRDSDSLTRRLIMGDLIDFRNLTHSTPAMLRGNWTISLQGIPEVPDCVPGQNIFVCLNVEYLSQLVSFPLLIGYGPSKLEMPAGAGPVREEIQKIKNLTAEFYGWGIFDHSSYVGSDFQEIAPWWTEVLLSIPTGTERSF